MAAFKKLRMLARLAREAPERLTHAARRRASIATLRRNPLPRSILVLCHGNVCRSPYAEVALRLRLEAARLPIDVASAGFIGPDRSPPPEALAAAIDRGSDMSGHVSQLVRTELLDRSDLVVVMNRGQEADILGRRPRVTRRVLVLGDLDPQSFALHEIADPWGRPRSAFDACYDRIDRCVETLVASLSGLRGIGADGGR
jgi:protein-tyrosine phosphatase